MPTYDLQCPECDAEYRNVVMSISSRGTKACDSCGHTPLESRSWPTGISGPTETRPLRLGGDGTVITTPGQLREYERNNPSARILAKDDSWLRKHKDNAREKAERLARKKGHNDWDAFQSHSKKEKAKAKSG